jgi:hypothetical protein
LLARGFTALVPALPEDREKAADHFHDWETLPRWLLLTIRKCKVF